MALYWFQENLNQRKPLGYVKSSQLISKSNIGLICDFIGKMFLENSNLLMKENVWEVTLNIVNQVRAATTGFWIEKSYGFMGTFCRNSVFSCKNQKTPSQWKFLYELSVIVCTELRNVCNGQTNSEGLHFIWIYRHL